MVLLPLTHHKNKLNSTNLKIKRYGTKKEYICRKSVVFDERQQSFSLF